jgi:hypothetical protein
MATNFSNVPVYLPYPWRDQTLNSDFKVRFPDFAEQPKIIFTGADLTQTQAEHDRLVLYVKGKPFRLEDTVKSEDLVVFTYTTDKNVVEWHGYVTSIEQNSDIQGVAQTFINCIGASYVFKDTDQKIYRDVTADQVVARVCQKHSFSANTQRHPRVKSSISQTGQSDWQFLRSLAMQTGYALRADNTTITFCSKNKITDAKKTSAPYFYYIDSPTGGNVPTTLRTLGSIVAFKPIISDYSPEMGVTVDRVVSGFNIAAQTTVKTTHPHFVNTSGKGAVTPSQDYFS